MGEKRKKSIFPSVLIIVFGILFIAMAFAWEYLYRFLEAYEKNVPTNAANSVAELYKAGNFTKILEMQGVSFDEFNTPEEYAEYIHRVYGEDFSAASAYKTAVDGENQIYTIYCDKTKLCTITISPNGNIDEFGLQGWNVAMEQLTYPKLHSVKIYAPENASASVNGIVLGDKNTISEEHSIKAYDDLFDENMRPKFKVYEVTGLLNVPEVSVTDATGAQMKLTEKNGKFYALPEVSPEFEEMIKARTEEIALKYALYSILDLKFEDISAYLYKDSEYYKRVKSFYNDWYREHTFSYDGVKFEDITVYDDTHCSAHIYFTYHIDIGYKVIDYDVSYNMFYILSDGQWMLCGMEL